MSSYSFSHQFYQHWTGAPEPVRAAIVQELTDITDLLQTETPFEKFVFSTHDLDAHLDDLYCAYDIQQATAKKLADEQAQQAAEQQRLEEQKKQAQEAKVKKEQRQQLETERQAKAAQSIVDTADKNVTDVNANTNNDTDNENANANVDNNISANDKKSNIDDKQTDKVNTASNTPVKAVKDSVSSHSAIDLSLKNTKLTAGHEDLIHELEMSIDDYLTEQMLQMSENLKSWLRAEISRQLAEQSQADDGIVDKSE